MNTPTFKNARDQWCYDEATRDVIFLLQSLELELIEEPVSYRVDYEEGMVFVHEDHWDEFEVERDYTKPYVLTSKEAYEQDIGYWKEIWHTESVWFSRQEATTFAERTKYRYGYGYRVYGVCAEGELARILKSVEHNYPVEESNQLKSESSSV